MNESRAGAIADASRYFDAWLRFRQRFDRVPGVQAAVLSGDAIVMACAHGLADVEAATALTEQHLFRIASHSKTFTATAIMQLVERGVVRLDDAVGSWLPFLAGSPSEHVTLRELLSHASGTTRDGREGDFWQLAYAFPDAAGLHRISLDGAAVIDRNERFKYSNIGFSLLGQVIEAASGQPYGEYVQQHIIQVLGLADTGHELDPNRAGEYAAGYSALTYGDRRVPIDHIDTGSMASATGFYSTASDVVRYVAGHFHGNDALVSDQSKRMMQRVEWEVEGTGGTAYGLGFAISTIGTRRVLGHGGGYPGHITRTYFDPLDELAVSVLTNAIDGPALVYTTAGFRLIDLALTASTGEQPPDAAATAAFTGRFANLWGVFDIVQMGGRLFQIDPSQPDPVVGAVHLDVVDDNTLRIARTTGYGSFGEQVVVTRNDAGAIVSLRGGSGSTSYPFDAMVAALESRERITLGDPLAP
jgi:CubicO group peptidase (beta-lactamase class C family)